MIAAHCQPQNIKNMSLVSGTLFIKIFLLFVLQWEHFNIIQWMQNIKNI